MCVDTATSCLKQRRLPVISGDSSDPIPDSSGYKSADHHEHEERQDAIRLFNVFAHGDVKQNDAVDGHT